MIPCPECSRFVRTDARHCPFCDAVMGRERSGLVPAMMGALLGLGVSACGGDDSGTSNGDATDQSTYEYAVAAYGGPDTSLSGPPDTTATSSSSGPGTTAEATETGTGTGTGTGTATSTATETGTGTGTGTSAGASSTTGA